MRSPLVALVLALPLVANAQPGADPPAEPEPPPPAPTPPPPTPAPPPPIVVAPPAPVNLVDRGVIEDANSGRNWLTPTALTPPKGTWSFSDFELLMVSGGYAFTDQFQLSVTTLLPVFEEMPFFGILSGKYQLVKSGNVRLAAQVAVMHMSERTDELDNFALTVGNVGGALTVCIDSDCHSHFTGYLGAGFADEDQSAVPFIASAAVALRLGRHVKALFEVDTAFVLGDINEESDFYLGWYGVRFTSKMIGVDLGFMKPICGDDCDSDELPMGFPFVSFTYRDFKE
jgi:hypothetical protein